MRISPVRSALPPFFFNFKTAQCPSIHLLVLFYLYLLLLAWVHQSPGSLYSCLYEAIMLLKLLILWDTDPRKGKASC